MECARAADEALARGEAVGPLHGLPIAHKDLQRRAGIRTTFGSPIYHGLRPRRRLAARRADAGSAGAILVGKTNTPEFGAGSQTFNPVFGATRNPYDLTKTCGGSSGGAAVALACGMLPLADGSDMGGSLRNPASFCGVVGLRPSPGRVPAWPSTARLVAAERRRPDGAQRRGRRAAAQRHRRAGSAFADRARRARRAVFAAPLDRDFKGVRIAWWTDLGGLPFDPARHAASSTRSARVFESLGCIVEEAEPDFAGADEVFKTLRAMAFVAGCRRSVAAQHDRR